MNNLFMRGLCFQTSLLLFEYRMRGKNRFFILQPVLAKSRDCYRNLSVLTTILHPKEKMFGYLDDIKPKPPIHHSIDYSMASWPLYES